MSDSAKKNSNFLLSSFFESALSDYWYLLKKGYPEKEILHLVGNRYRLNTLSRTILKRGILDPDYAASNYEKIIEPNEIASNILFIDGYNVLATITSYLEGRMLFIGNDGFLRDAAEKHGSVGSSPLFDKATRLCLVYIKKLNPSKTVFYFDSPVKKSGERAAKIRELLEEYGLKGESMAVKSPDHELASVKDGVCATGDSVVLSRSNKVCDLACLVLQDVYSPSFFDVRLFLHNM